MINSNTFFDPTKILQNIGITEGMSVADMGAGNGYMSFAAAKIIGKTGIIYALDVKKILIKHLETEIKNKNIANIKPIWTNFEINKNNPIKSSSINAVLIINTLYQSTKYMEILQEAKRMARPGGIIAIVDWKKETQSPFGPLIDERVNLEKIKQIAYTLELNRIKEFSPGPYHFGIVFKK